MNKLSISDLKLAGKRVFMRVDFNVPIVDGKITDDARIEAALPSIRYVLDGGGRLILLQSHLGRRQGEARSKVQLETRRASPWRITGQAGSIRAGLHRSRGSRPRVGTEGRRSAVASRISRFHAEEEKNDSGFARQLAALCDVYVNDAFGTAHRAHASTAGIASFVGQAAAGFLMQKEIESLSHALTSAEKPYVSIVGGSKISDKIELVENFMNIANTILIGGAMAYTFLRAKGLSTGKSLVEEDKIELAKALMEKAAAKGVALELPVDHVVAAGLDSVDSQVTLVTQTPANLMGLDIGPETVKRYSEIIGKAKTIVWNGPMGVFENPRFAAGTFAIAKAVADSHAFSIIGGGDSASAVAQSGMESKITHISTGGGASLEFLSGQKLPGVEVLTERGKSRCVNRSLPATGRCSKRFRRPARFSTR